MRTVVFRTWAAVAAWSGVAEAQVTSVDRASVNDQTTTSAQDDGLADIVVTAQRREERLQDVPIAVTATTADRLASVGITNTQDLSIVTPGLIAQQSAGYSQPFIRGVGSTAVGAGVERPVATYIDGVYIAAAPAALVTLNNVERIEVLKGPQGTLFGRNATGGLVQVITRDPGPNPKMAVNLTYGNYRTVIADAYVAGGLAENLSADIAVRYEHQSEGWGSNLGTGNKTGNLDHDFAARSKLVFEPSTTTKVVVTGDYESRQSRRESQHLDPQLPQPLNTPFFGGPYPQGTPYDINNEFDPEVRLSSGGGSLDVNQNIGSLRLRSITAYRVLQFDSSLDLDNNPRLLIRGDISQKSSQFSQELQLGSDGATRFNWVAGVYYFEADDKFNPALFTFGASPLSPVPGTPATSAIFGRQKANSIAGFGQATYELLENTKLTLGARYTYEEKQINGNSVFTVFGRGTSTPIPPPTTGIPDKLDFNKFNYRIALDHKLSNAVLVYASYSTGFKSGGYNVAVPANRPYEPESIKAAEAGVKTELFDRHLRFNLAGFHYDYGNIQVARYQFGVQTLYNGAQAELYGFDFDVDAVITRQLKVFGGFAYNHARFTSFPNADFVIPVGNCVPAPGTFCSGEARGKTLPFAPETTVNVGVEYKVNIGAGSVALGGTYYRTGRYFSNPDNAAVQRAYDLVNASITWADPDDRLSVKLWGRNLGDTVYSAALTESARGVVLGIGAPRTYGVTAGYRF